MQKNEGSKKKMDDCIRSSALTRQPPLLTPTPLSLMYLSNLYVKRCACTSYFPRAAALYGKQTCIFFFSVMSLFRSYLHVGYCLLYLHVRIIHIVTIRIL